MNLGLFGKKIKNLRLLKEKDLAEVSAAISIDKTFLSKLENGLRRPSIMSLNSLLNYYQVSRSSFGEFYELCGFPHVSTNLGLASHIDTEGKEVYEGNMNQDMNVDNSQPQINVPNNLSILYSDVISVTASPFGLVLDYGQRMGPTNQVNIVSRIGLSKEHGEALLQVLAGKIREMQLLTKKTNKKND